MAIIVGTGEHRYEVVENWGRLPDGWHYGEVAAVGVDSKDNVYVFARSEHPMMVFDREGNFLRSWGEGLFRRPHGVHLAPDDTIYCTDDGDHTVRRLYAGGKAAAGDRRSRRTGAIYGGDPFNRCTHTALSPEGDIYVADGYGNARVHKYSPNGKLQFSWGEPGTEPGAIQHSAQHLLRRGRLDLRGGSREPPHPGVRRQGQIRHPVEQHAPAVRAVHDARKNPIAYIGESGPGHGSEREIARHRPARQHLDARRQACAAR